jgi:phage protein D
MEKHLNVAYNGKNISESINQYLLEVTYTDNVTGVRDDLEIRLADREGRWQNEWYPSKGALLSLELGYKSGRILKPNVFEIDEIELSFSKMGGDEVVIKAVSGGINKALHTKRSHAHENKTLGEIVRTVAAKYNLQVVGTIEDITIGRVSQYREKDFTFLARLADEYGYSFSVKGTKLAFVKLTTLEARSKVAVIDKTDCISCTIKDKAHATYEATAVKSYNPNKRTLVQSTYGTQDLSANDDQQYTFLAAGSNTLEVRTKTENEAQAIVKARAALHRANSLMQTVNITLPGNPLLIAGVNIELTGLGRCSGIWNILKSVHNINKSNGYLTMFEAKRVVPSTLSGSAKKPKKVVTKSPNYSVTPPTNNSK